MLGYQIGKIHGDKDSSLLKSKQASGICKCKKVDMYQSGFLVARSKH
jgi:hypothetical protein